MKIGFVTLALGVIISSTLSLADPAGGGESSHEDEPIFVKQEKLGGIFLRGLGLEKFFGMFNLHGFGGHAGMGFKRGFPYGKPFGHGPRIPHVPEIYNYGPLIPLHLIPTKKKVEVKGKGQKGFRRPGALQGGHG
ncbi:uncharacterized protein [Palaemon carinicauda]|uniref:uncharacterized protein n=1 Tax=Palaemon carinicauda TaxID=392227 RepID=UPI0035B60A4A